MHGVSNQRLKLGRPPVFFDKKMKKFYPRVSLIKLGMEAFVRAIEFNIIKIYYLITYQSHSTKSEHIRDAPCRSPRKLFWFLTRSLFTRLRLSRIRKKMAKRGLFLQFIPRLNHHNLGRLQYSPIYGPYCRHFFLMHNGFGKSIPMMRNVHRLDALSK